MGMSLYLYAPQRLFEKHFGQSQKGNQASDIDVARMDSVQYQYIRFTKTLLCITGHWFEQTTLEQILIAIIFVPIILGQGFLQGAGMIAALNLDDVDTFVEGIASFFASWMCIFKYIFYVYKKEKMRSLLNVIQEDWKIYSKSKHEQEILCRNYAAAKKVTLGYAASMYGSMTPFMVQPALIYAANALGFQNSTEPPLMFRVEYVVNRDLYYFPVLIHSYLSTLAYITILVGVDSLIMIYVQHGGGMCEILGHRLADLTEDAGLDVDVYPEMEKDVPYRNARNCIIIHKHIIELAKNIEDANCTSAFLQLGLVLMALTFVEVQAMLRLSNPEDSFRYISFAMCMMTVLLLASWPGQQLIDHTDRIFGYTVNSNWYLSSINTRKLIRIMMLKSLTPLKLTAGKLYNLDLINFSAVARTSFSYLTVLSSVQ